MTYNTFFIPYEKDVRVRTDMSFIIHMIHFSLIAGVMYRYALQNFNKIKIFIEYMNTIYKVSLMKIVTDFVRKVFY